MEVTKSENKHEKRSTKKAIRAAVEKIPTVLEGQSEKLELKRQVNLFSAISIVLGSIIGSGIFITPKGLLEYSGSAPLSIIIWTACGIISLFGALSFAELGTLIPSSGGDYIYLLKGFDSLDPVGAISSFLFLWSYIIALSPGSSAVLALTVAEYIIEPLYPSCTPPFLLKKLVAALAICSIAYFNCASVKLTTSFNNFFTSAKLAALVIIIFCGILTVSKDGIPPYITNFEGSTKSPTDIATAIYFGMWAYSGWNSLNVLTEEIIEPEKNILRAVLISVPVVTICYVLTNIAYLTAMSPGELLSSNAVALLFANKLLGKAAPVIPVLVAASAYGCALVGCLGTARIAFVAAREGHLLSLLSYIHVDNLTPIPAIIFNTTLSIGFLLVGTFDSLINFLSFSTWMFIGLEMLALLYMRWSKKHEDRAYKVNVLCPIITLLTSLFLVIAPIAQDPRWEYLYATLFMISGLIFYVPFVHFKIHLDCIDKFTIYIQLLLSVAPSDMADESKNKKEYVTKM